MSDTAALHADLRIASGELAALRQVPSWRVPLQATALLSLYATLAVAGTHPTMEWARFLLWPFMGLMLAGCLAAAHDCLHNTHLGSRTANRVAGVLWCMPILMNATIYRYHHLAHHRFTSVPGDTEDGSVFSTVRAYVWSLTGMSFHHHFLGLAWRAAFGRYPAYVQSERQRRAIAQDNAVLAAWITTALAATVAKPDAMIAAYWGPLAFYAPMVLFTGLPEHYGCDRGRDLRGNTRSMTTNVVVRFLLWNANYHAEHHAYPNVPACNLGQLHARIGLSFRHSGHSYVAFHWDLLRSLCFGLPKSANRN